jgi:hypothetical protein
MAVHASDLTAALPVLVRSNGDAPGLTTAANLRELLELFIEVIGNLEFRDRGSRIFSGELLGGAPEPSLGMEGDLYLAFDSSDFWGYVDGEWVFLFNARGADGADGQSAYQLWLALGNSGSESDFLASFQGSNGQSAYQLWLAQGNSGTEATFLASIRGSDGTDGTNGTNGVNGASWLDGPADPLVGQGIDGDYYDQHDGRVWKKVSGAWVHRFTRVGGSGSTGTDVDITDWNGTEKAAVLTDSNWNSFGYYTPGVLTITGPYAYLVKLATATTYGYEYRTVPNPAGAGVIVTRTKFV